MPAFDNFRKNINKLIAEKKITIMGLSKETGISRTLLYGYLAEGKDIDLSKAEKLAAAAGESLRGIIGDEAPAFAPPRAPTPEEMALHILDALRLPEAKLRAIRAVLLATNGEMLGINAAANPVANRINPSAKEKKAT